MQQDSIGCPLENRVQWNHKSGQVERLFAKSEVNLQSSRDLLSGVPHQNSQTSNTLGLQSPYGTETGFTYMAGERDMAGERVT
jgi:hypothetical protein